MKCEILFSGKNKKNIANSSVAELAQRVIKDQATNCFFVLLLLFFGIFRNCYIVIANHVLMLPLTHLCRMDFSILSLRAGPFLK